MGHSDLHQGLRTPRAAAMAGIVFSVLSITSHVLVWISIPANLGGPAVDVISHSKTISLALNLLPFAGIAFLWFIAVVRNRLGTLEDRFFSTVFLGSGLLYIAMIFTSAALAGGLIRVLISSPDLLTQTGTYAMSRLIVAAASGILARLFTIIVRPPLASVISSKQCLRTLSSKLLKRGRLNSSTMPIAYTMTSDS